ncbi:hypothetical protein EON80_25540 [bacterium]|nr:MAG: hypothetical protein EON80_25540 [bacterium]
MPSICKYHCTSCDFTVSPRSDGYLYVTDGEGTRIPCLHPGEFRTVQRVLEASNPEAAKLFASFIDPYSRWKRGIETIKAKLQGREPPITLERLMRERTGFSSYCVCRQCLHEFDIDLRRDELLCPRCSSGSVSSLRELIGKSCPQCVLGKIKMKIVGKS